MHAAKTEASALWGSRRSRMIHLAHLGNQQGMAANASQSFSRVTYRHQINTQHGSPAS
jgi:hypothetical protein